MRIPRRSLTLVAVHACGGLVVLETSSACPATAAPVPAVISVVTDSLAGGSSTNQDGESGRVITGPVL